MSVSLGESIQCRSLTLVNTFIYPNQTISAKVDVEVVSMHKVKIEICSGSAADAIEAAKGNATRVELCSSLFLGGLTPSIGSLQTVKKHTDIDVMAMVRPREGGFCYTDVEYETVLLDAVNLLQHGADGLVFGFLHQDGTIDVDKTAELVSLAGDKETCFHRAFDVVSDWKRALDQLIEIGVTRVLTSGLMPQVMEALDTIKEMVDYADGRIEILPGGGIRPPFVRHVVEMTGVDQVHLTLHRLAYDRSTGGNSAIHFGGALYPPEDRYKVTDAEAVKRLIEEVK